MKIIKNTTLSDIDLEKVGTSIPASGQIEIPTQQYLLWADEDAITEIYVHLLSGDLVVNDGVDDITVANGFNIERAKNYLENPDHAFYARFASQPERMNGFVAKNVQEAIEEAKAAIEGKVSVLPTFLNNGLTKNKWLSLDGAMASSDSLPAVTAFDSKLAAMTYINNRDNTDVDIEFYSNGVLVYTWNIRNKRYAYKTDALSGTSFSQGDRISCFAKQVTDHTSNGGDGTGTDPTSVIVFINVQTVNSIVGEGGGPTL
jgi:hypothetical protein